MKRIALYLIGIIFLTITALGIYAYSGWSDAARDAPSLKAEAHALIAARRGADQLSQSQKAILLKVEDPLFYDHNGLDFSTPGAGVTTLTQALAKRVGFKSFEPGIGKLRQSAYALSLERRLAKDEILTLALHHAEMGKGPEGWVTGFLPASEIFYGKPVAALSEPEFIGLVAVLIAPGRLSPLRPSDAYETRIDRIARLANGECAPNGHSDVWLEGCA